MHTKIFWHRLAESLRLKPQRMVGTTSYRNDMYRLPHWNSPREEWILQGFTIGKVHSSYVGSLGQVLIFYSRATVPEWILEKKIMEDCSLRASRVCHSSSSSISPTLLEFLHRLQVHLAAVLCTFSTCAVWVYGRDAKQMLHTPAEGEPMVFWWTF